MHSDVLRWTEYALKRAGANTGGDILEMGSRNWNGTPRHLFTGSYIGVDLQAGDCVDVVADCANLRHQYADENFDIVLCLEVLEHSNKKREILSEMFRVLKTGGIGIVTAGAPGRPEHDGGTAFYENVNPLWLINELLLTREWGLEMGPNEAETPDIRAWFRR